MKKTLIIIGIVVALIVMVIAMNAGTYNRAIGAEEQINEAKSAIEVQQKRRIDLIYNLVDTVEAYADYEQETLDKVISARAQASSGSIDEAQMAIAAVAEAYPDLKANENYKELMNELSITENLIAQQRENYNIQVKSYKKFTRGFPNNIVLGIVGYDIIDYDYLDFDAPVDAPQNLFGE